jgi:hypothetical protein
MLSIDQSSNKASIVPGQATLDQLAAKVRDAHAGVVAAFGKAVQHALTAGQTLNAAKSSKQIPHGQWLPFLKRCDLNERTAQRYMQLAELAESNASCATLLADLSIERAIKRLSPKQPQGSTDRRQLQERHKAVEPPAPAKTTHADIVAAWIGAVPEERSKAIDSIGIRALLTSIPPAWWPLIEKRVADRRQISAPSVAATLPTDDLSIPSFLQREPLKLVASTASTFESAEGLAS